MTVRRKIAFGLIFALGLIFLLVASMIAWFCTEYASMESFRNKIEQETLEHMTHEERIDWMKHRARVGEAR